MSSPHTRTILIAALVAVFIAVPVHRAWMSLNHELQMSKTQLRNVNEEIKSQKSLLDKAKKATAAAEVKVTETSKECEAKLQEAGQSTIKEVERMDRECDAKIKEQVEKEKESCPGGSLEEVQEKISSAAKNSKDSLARDVLDADARVLKSMLEAHNETMSGAWEKTLSKQPERGILFLAGPEIYSVNTFVSLWAIRKHWNSSLPVIILYVCLFSAWLLATSSFC